MAALMLCLGATDGAGAELVDCGPAPSVKCLAAAILSLAKALPDDDGFRRHIGFAERELAPGDLKTALDYVVSDNPDPLPWEDIYWIARRALRSGHQAGETTDITGRSPGRTAGGG